MSKKNFRRPQKSKNKRQDRQYDEEYDRVRQIKFREQPKTKLKHPKQVDLEDD